MTLPFSLRQLLASWLSSWLSIASLAACCAAAQAQNLATAEIPAGPRFDILEFVVEGNTVLEPTVIERAVYPHMGEGRSFDDVQAAAKALQQAYRERGFGLVAVDIPEQGVASGVIRLNVVEGRVSRLRVLGAVHHAPQFVLERVPAVAEQTVPNLSLLQGQLTEINRTADRRVTPNLRPGREFGTTEVDLVVEDKLPLHGSVSLNNQAGPNSTPTRLQAAVSYDNFFQRDHNLGLQAVLSPEKLGEVQVVAANYSVPLGPGGLESFSLSVTRSDSKVAAGLAGSTLLGKGTLVGLRRTFMLNLTDTEFHLLTLGLDHKAFEDTVTVSSGADDFKPITYLPLSMAWLGSYRLGRQEWQFGVNLSAGVKGLVNEEDQFRAKRYQAHASYVQLRSDARLSTPLPWWGLRGTVAIEGQLSNGPLISNEQFILGGVSSVRGYRESEAAGDWGLRSSLQISTQDLVKPTGLPWLSSLSAHLFVDGGLAGLLSPLPGQDTRLRLLGAGVGMQAGLKGWVPLSLSLSLATPLLRSKAIGSDGTRLHVNASLGF